MVPVSAKFDFDDSITKISTRYVQRSRGGRARISYAPPVYANWDEVQDEMWPWVVEFKQEPADFRSAKFGARLMHNSVRSALRIASDAFFFTLEPTSCQPGVSGSLAGEFGLLPRRSDLPIPDEAKYQLTQEIRSSAEMLWLGQLNFANERSTIALRRFNLAYAGRDVEDALIDLWIGLEALFAGSEPEISHKVALRIAYYLGKSPTERRSLFRLVKDSYNARSRLVHGDEVGDLKLARKTAKQTLRLALMRVLTDQAVPALAELDDISAAGEVPPTNPPAALPAPES